MRSVSSADVRAASRAAAIESNITTGLSSAPNSSAMTRASPDRLAGVLCRVSDIGQRRQRPDDPAHILVRRYRDHQVQPIPDEELAERGGERLRARGVVSAVEQDGGMTSDDLQPAGPSDGGERLAGRRLVERLVDQRLDGRDGRRSVPRGVLAEHRQEQVVVGPVDPAYPQRLSAHRPQALLDLEIAMLEPQLRADIRAPLLDHAQRLVILLPADRDAALLDDPRLLPRHLGDRGPELRMVEGDRA